MRRAFDSVRRARSVIFLLSARSVECGGDAQDACDERLSLFLSQDWLTVGLNLSFGSGRLGNGR